MPEDPAPSLRPVAPGRYSEFEVVGKGGMGVVYLALDSELNRRVAFKIVLPGADDTTDSGAPATPLDATPPQNTEGTGRSFGELKARFLQEAWVTGGMEHPGIVPVYELGETGEGVPYYTMRYVRGERTLKQAVEQAADLEDRLFLLEPFLKVCDTIRFAHARGVVHRDLKPENIAIGEFGEVVVLDWGLAKVEGRPDVTSQRWQERIEAYRDATDLKTVAGALGTPGFMAPEAALGDSAEVDAKSDVYSLGALLFRILTGRLPFEFDNFLEYVNKVLKEDPPRADEIDPSIPRELADACERALSRERGDRFEHVAELARAVRVWQTEGPIEREIRALLDQARDEVDAAQGLEGNLLLLHLDRATASLNRILHLRADHDAAQQLQARVKRMRERGIRARVRSDRLSVLQRVAAGLLGVGAIVALVVFGLLNEERRRAEERQAEADERIDAAERVKELALGRADAADADVAAAYATIAEALLADGRAGPARLLAAQGLDRRDDPALWRVLARADARWTPTLRLAAHGVRARSLQVAGGDEPALLVGDDDGRVHDLAAGKRESWIALGAAVTAVCRLPGGRVAAGGADGRLAVLAPGENRPSFVVPAELPRPPANVAFDDATLYRGTAVTALAPGLEPGAVVAGYADGRLRLFDRDGAILFVARHHAGAVTALHVRDGMIGSGAADGSVNLTDFQGLVLTDTWECGRPVAGLRVENGAVRAWSRDGAVWTPESTEGGGAAEGETWALLEEAGLLVSAGADGALVFRAVAAGHLAGRGTPGAAVTAVDAGALLAVARDDGTVRVWDPSMRGGVAPPGAAHRASGRTAAARRDGSIVVRLMIAEADPVPLRADEPDRVTAVAFGPRGDRLAAVSLTGRITVWDAATGEEIRRLRGQETPLTAVSWAQGEGRLLTGDLEGTVRIWHWPSGRPLSLPGSADSPIACVSDESPAYRVAAADASGAVHLWDSDSKRRIRTWRDVGRIVAIAVAPAGESLVAAREDGALLRCEGGPWTEVGRLPDGAVPVVLGLHASGEATWVDQRGLAGTGTRHDEAAPLPADAIHAPWVQIGAGARLRGFAAAFGLAVEDPFGARLAPPGPDWIDLAR